MKINRVTITGADNEVHHAELLKLSMVYPFVEWGILLSQSKEGTQRYPNKAWIDELIKLELNLSAHFCGWWSREIFEKQNFDLITNLDKKFQRVQLNYNLKNFAGWDLAPIIKYAETHPERGIIFQYNKANGFYLEKLIKTELPGNIQFLYDSSGGNGTEIKTIENPFVKLYTGYSGGLNNENIGKICFSILNNENPDYVWIDLESGVRTNNNFDLSLAESILNKSSHFITDKEMA